MGTTMRGEIRRLTRSGDSRVICPVTVEGVEALTPHFSRVTVQGDGLAAYRTIRPADAFKLIDGQTAEGRDAEAMKWYTRAAEEGLDVTDPAVLQSLEFS